MRDVFFLVLIVAPVWILYRITRRYSVLLACRRIMKYSYIVFCVIGIVLRVFIYLPDSIPSITCYEKWSFYEKWLFFSFFALIPALSPLFYYVAYSMSVLNLNFYNSSHIKNLDYFILYLRSFKDDRRRRIEEHNLLRLLCSNYYRPYAVGRPNEIAAPYGSANRLYIGEDWKERVLEMMEKTPLILLRINNTENFYWEFEQCVINNYFEKSVFWVSDVKFYVDFVNRAKTLYQIEFPGVENICDNCVVFKKGDDFTFECLNDKDSETLFISQYEELHHLKNDAPNYFRGRNVSLIKQFFTWKYDSLMMKGVQKWSWTAFFIPELYVIIQHFPHKGLVYLLLLLLFPLTILFRVPIMVFMGRNGRKLVWLSEKWESLDYFEQIHKENNKWVIVVFISFLLVFGASLWYLFESMYGLI